MALLERLLADFDAALEWPGDDDFDEPVPPRPSAPASPDPGFA